MEFLGLAVVWPFLVFAIGIVVFSVFDILSGIGGSSLAFLFWPFLLVVLLHLFSRVRLEQQKGIPFTEQLSNLRRGVVIFSIALILPVFTNYLIQAANSSLWSIIVGLVFGFGVLVWGIFIEKERLIMYANIFGGALALIYAYFRIWELGSFPRVVAAGIGLAVAVIVAVVKLKDKIT